MLDRDEKEILVDQVDDSREEKHRRSENNNSSVNMQDDDQAIDAFISTADKNSHFDTENHAKLLKSSRFSYMAGSHGFTVN